MRQRWTTPRRPAIGALLTALLIAGCGGAVPVPSSTLDAAATQATPSVEASPSAVASPSPSASPAASGLAAELVTAGRFTYCVNLRPGPMSFRDDSGKPAGVDIEIAQEIARRLGLTPGIKEMPFAALIDAVAGGQCDISISAQHITSTRLQRIDMLPYAQGTQHVVVRAGNPAGIVVLTDLCGKVLAVQTGSTHVDLVLGQGDHAGAGIDRDCASAGKPKVDLRTFDDDAAAVAALAAGTADAYIGSDFVAIDRPKEFQLATALPPVRNGIGLPKDHPALRAAVDGALQAMIGDRTYLVILKRWGVEGLSIAK
ncbi:MAG: transporter substrate-binding domain-containing protein [Chloroflexota bacterium]|nr:transporter substrate-binding domain-containing protein [Chloroflexota bacterium]